MHEIKEGNPYKLKWESKEHRRPTPAKRQHPHLNPERKYAHYAGITELSEDPRTHKACYMDDVLHRSPLPYVPKIVPQDRDFHKCTRLTLRGEEGIEMEDIKLISVALTFHDRLRSIFMHRVYLQNEGIAWITEGMQHERSNITSLHIEDGNFGDDGILALANGLADDKINLVELALYRLNRVSANGVQILFDALRNNTRLRRLELRGSGLGYEAAKHVASFLQNPGRSALKVLGLQWNGFNDEGAAILATGLKNATVQRLDLTGNDISDIGVRYLAAGLVENERLEKLTLMSNLITDVGASLIAEALKDNDVLWAINLHDNAISKAGAQSFHNLLAKNNQRLREVNLGADSGVRLQRDYSFDAHAENRLTSFQSLAALAAQSTARNPDVDWGESLTDTSTEKDWAEPAFDRILAP